MSAFKKKKKKQDTKSIKQNYNYHEININLQEGKDNGFWKPQNKNKNNFVVFSLFFTIHMIGAFAKQMFSLFGMPRTTRMAPAAGGAWGGGISGPDEDFSVKYKIINCDEVFVLHV